MKKAIAVLALGAVAFASSAMGLTFTEDFETGTGNELNSNWYTPDGWVDYNARSSGSTYNHTPGGSYGFLVNNNYPATNKYLATHLFGETLQATASQDLHMDYWLKSPGTSRNKGDWAVELAMGDYHAPAYGTVLTEAIPVIAYGKPIGSGVYGAIFNGKQWHQLGDMVGDTWHNFTLDIRPDGTASIAMVGRASNSNYVLQYTGGFDRVNIIANGGHTAGGYWNVIDDLTITGVPEPMTLVLLGLGGLFLRRRRA